MESYILGARLCKHFTSYITIDLFRRMAASKYKTSNYTETICVTCVIKFIHRTKYLTRSLMCQILTHPEPTVN